MDCEYTPPRLLGKKGHTAVSADPNLLFFSRHTELDRRKLDPRKNKDDRRLTQEWSQILVKEVRPAIRKAAEDRDLKVSGSFVAERDPELSGEEGKKFKEMVVWARAVPVGVSRSPIPVMIATRGIPMATGGTIRVTRVPNMKT